MARTAEIFSSSIVAVGNFNPAIFSPDWMEANKVIGKDDADYIREKRPGSSLIVSQQASVFESKWFVLQVLENQFSLTSKNALSPAFRDLAVSIFKLVPHTPVSAVGLNYLAHYKLASEDEYHNVGDALAPKAIWNSLFPGEAAGLAELTVRIQAGTRSKLSSSKDEKRISLQPSAALRFGAFVTYNAHHDLGGDVDNHERPGDRVAAIIDSEWVSSWHDAVRVFEGLLTMACEKGTDNAHRD